jgi:hypothetical protein
MQAHAIIDSSFALLVLLGFMLVVKAGSGLGNGGQKQVGPTMEDCRVLTIRLWD